MSRSAVNGKIKGKKKAQFRYHGICLGDSALGNTQWFLEQLCAVLRVYQVFPVNAEREDDWHDNEVEINIFNGIKVKERHQYETIGVKGEIGVCGTRL
jgi:hypothetical protein